MSHDHLRMERLSALMAMCIKNVLKPPDRLLLDALSGEQARHLVLFGEEIQSWERTNHDLLFKVFF